MMEKETKSPEEKALELINVFGLRKADLLTNEFINAGVNVTFWKHVKFEIQVKKKFRNALPFRITNGKMLAAYCVLPVIADFIEDFEHNDDLQVHVDQLIDLVREIDDYLISSEADMDKRIGLIEQQLLIQRAFRDFVINQFGLAQKDIPKIKAKQL